MPCLFGLQENECVCSPRLCKCVVKVKRHLTKRIGNCKIPPFRHQANCATKLSPGAFGQIVFLVALLSLLAKRHAISWGRCIRGGKIQARVRQLSMLKCGTQASCCLSLVGGDFNHKICFVGKRTKLFRD